MQCSGARIFSRKSGFGGHQKANFSLARAETALAKAFLSRGARAKKGHILTVLTCEKTCMTFVLTAHFQFSVEIRRSAALELEHIFWLKLGGCAHPWHDRCAGCTRGSGDASGVSGDCRAASGSKDLVEAGEGSAAWPVPV